MDSMTDDDMSLPIDFNESTQPPRLMDTLVHEGEGAGKFAEVRTIKDHEMYISELKKENFELKLRIYFLEEKLQSFKRDTDDDDSFKTNIELKVEIEQLKTELNEKRRLLVKASAAVESLDRNHQDEKNKLTAQYNRDLAEVKQSYETKIKENEELNQNYETRIKGYEKLLNAAKVESESLKSRLIEAERSNRKIKDDFSKPGPTAEEVTAMQAQLQENIREKDRVIEELKSAVDIRESRIKLLNKADDGATKEQIKGLNQKIEERDSQIQDLKEKLRKTETSVKGLRGELHENERKLQLTAQANNSLTQKFNEKVGLKQAELDEVQEKFRALQQKLEKAQDIIDEASLKDVEAFEEKSKALKAKDALIAELQGNLKQKEMENSHLSRSIGRKDVELQKMQDTKSMQETAEQKVHEKEKELTALTEQLTLARNKLREATDKHDEELQKTTINYQSQLAAKDLIIHRVTETLEEKESIIQDLIVAQDNISQSSSLDDITDSKEELIQKLRERLKERDTAVEANIEDKFQALNKKEEELQELRKGLRERDRLIENINAVVLQQEDTVKNLESVIVDKTNLVNALKVSLQNQQKQFEEASEAALKKTHENEGLVEKLKRNLSNREQQIENLKIVLQRSTSKEGNESEESELVNELSKTLKEKEKMLADLLNERSQMIERHEADHQKLTNALAEKEDQLKEMSEKTEKLCSENTTVASRLQQQINSLNLDVQALENSKEWAQQEHEILLGKMRQSLTEKDRTIEKLINSGKEKDKVFLKLQEYTTNRSTSPVRLEITSLKNTIQDLQSELQEKQDIIERLERAKEENSVKSSSGSGLQNVENTAELELELEQKDSLLKQAAETIEAFQVKLNNFPVLEEMKKNLEETQLALSESEEQKQELQKNMQNLLDRESCKVHTLEKELASLKRQIDALFLEDNITERQHEDQVKRLRGLLLQQIEETLKLSQMLQKERKAYESVTKRANTVSGPNGFSKIDGELELISELRRSLEDGIKQNNKLRAQLHEKIASPPRAKPDQEDNSQLKEVSKLQAKLEDSERWNMSLQSRLDALQPRARGVGGSTGNLTALGTTTDSPQPSDTEAVKKLKKEFDDVKLRLDESQRINARLRDELEHTKKATAEEVSGQQRLNEQQKKENALLRDELKKASKSSKPPAKNQSDQQQKELDEMYRKNDELRQSLTHEMLLADQNRKLKQDLNGLKHKNNVLEKQLENTAKKLVEMTAEVARLGDELDRAHALNIDYVSQIKGLHDQSKESGTGSSEELVGKKNVAETLKGEIRHLSSQLEKTGKENERLKVLLAKKKQEETTLPLISHTTTDVNKTRGLDATDSGPGSSLEIRALREKLDLSEKLNAALKYELEVNKKNAGKQAAAGEPLMNHLEELRELRSRLEESIRTYDVLRAQLEEKLSGMEGEDQETVVSDRPSLAKENEGLRAQLAQFANEIKNIQSQLEEQRMSGERDKQRLVLMHNQLTESNKANENLKKELAICDQVIKLSQQQNNDVDGSRSTTDSESSNNDAIMLLLAEVRSLRKQLEASIQSNNSLRQMLQKQLSSSPDSQPNVRSPVRGSVTRTNPVSQPVSNRSPLQASSLLRPAVRADEIKGEMGLESHSLEELRQCVNTSFHNCESLLVKVTRTILEGQDKDGHLEGITKELETLRSLLFKSNKLLDRLWAAQLSSGPTAADRLTKQNAELQKEITMLKKRVLSQSKILENTANRLESSSRMRKEVERSLFARLSETRDTLGSSRKILQNRFAAESDPST